jgi:hypothetical protein
LTVAIHGIWQVHRFTFTIPACLTMTGTVDPSVRTGSMIAAGRMRCPAPSGSRW